MNIVIDTNVLMAGLLKEGIVRKVLLSENMRFFIPEHALTEIEKYKEALATKSRIAKEDIDKILNMLLENIEIIQESKIKNKINKAKDIMKNIDVKDAPFIACALAINAEGIWSFDNDFKKQEKIRVYDIKELVKLI